MIGYAQLYAFLVMVCFLAFSALRAPAVFYADRGAVAVVTSALSERRRNLGLLSDYDDPKSAVKKSREENYTVVAQSTSNGTAAATDFVFLIAIEGSGHHMSEALFEKSPAMKRLHKLRRRVRPLVNDMLTHLYNNQDKSIGLFSAPTSKTDPDGASVVEALAQKMRAVDGAIEAASFPPPATLVPLNAGGVATVTTGMMSYPNFMGKHRALQYPDLDALYYACDLAGVQCRHVVLTRDPYAVLRSTTMHREFSSRHVAIQMYTTMLDVILVQMLTHRQRLAACWEYGDEPEDGLGELMGWKGDDAGLASFHDAYASLFNGEEEIDLEERLTIVPKELEVYMMSMDMATERVRTTCREILQAQKDVALNA